mgnify:CR=1 FL=1
MNRYVLNEDHMINGKSIKDTLTDIMSPYESATSITLLITDVADTKTPFMETSTLLSSSLGCLVKGNMNESLLTATNVRIAVVHKKRQWPYLRPWCDHYGGVNLPLPRSPAARGFFAPRSEQKASPAAFPAIARPGPAGDALVLQKMRLTSALRRGLRW